MTCYQQIGTVQKPYQYVGHEENAYRKDFDAARLRLCIAFPDAYEVGMSNVGMQIIYHVVNEEDGFLADRVYAPLVDMGAMLRRTGQKLQGRESGRALSEFDCVGFTLQYELCYTNVLYMLELGGIARRAQDRKEGDPLVMAGGPCVFNPEPVAAFFDFFVIGEGEEVVVEVCAAIEAAKAQGRSRQATLLALSKIKGVYVPSFFKGEYDDEGRFVQLAPAVPYAPRWVERRVIADLDTVKYPTKPVTPAIQPIHERVSVEIQRGCTRSCRFCQAGYIYRPRRERNPNRIMEIIEKSVEATGITELGLLSLSSADYSHLHPLMKEVMARYREKHLSISLPSTRLEALEEEYLDVLKEERRAGFTIAPEAGSQRLRNVINKNFTEAEVVDTARMLFKAGWQTIKMYFMIGQPTETDADVKAIAELGNAVIRKCADIPGRKQVTISVSNFVPKPHTPFQWHEQITHAEILRKQKLVRDSIEYKSQISFRSHAADNSLAEGMVARGDRRCADLIERAYDLGAVFDCWQDKFDIGIWLEAVRQLKDETGVDFLEQGLRGRSLDERLPWHRIYSGIHPKFFKNEYTKAVYGIATEDCSFSACHECGLCNETTGVKPVVLKEPVVVAEKLRPVPQQGDAASGPRVSYRFQYEKTDAGAYLTTLDLQNVLVRGFKRAGIHVVYDQGIRPRPKLSMGAALPLGVSSTCELFDIELETALTPQDVIAATTRFLPTHVRLKTGIMLEKGMPSLPQLVRAYSYLLHVDDLKSFGLTPASIKERIAAINSEPTFTIQRERKTRDGDVRLSSFNFKDSVETLIADDAAVRFTIYAPGGQGASPHIVIEALLGRKPEHEAATFIHKTGIHVTRGLDAAGLF